MKNLNETVIDDVRITKVGFVSKISNGDTFIHDWGFTAEASQQGEGYTVEQLQKISEGFYGDMLQTYRERSSYGYWCADKRETT